MKLQSLYNLIIFKYCNIILRPNNQKSIIIKKIQTTLRNILIN